MTFTPGSDGGRFPANQDDPYTAYLIDGYEAHPSIRYKTQYKTVPPEGNAEYNVRIDCVHHDDCIKYGFPWPGYNCPGYMYVNEEFIRQGRRLIRSPYCACSGEIKRTRLSGFLVEPELPEERKRGLLARIIAFFKALFSSSATKR